MPLLTEIPDRCPHGHPLGPGAVLAGHHPCLCPTADPVIKGHTTVQYTACLDAGVRTVHSTPPCAGESKGQADE